MIKGGTVSIVASNKTLFSNASNWGMLFIQFVLSRLRHHLNRCVHFQPRKLPRNKTAAGLFASESREPHIVPKLGFVAGPPSSRVFRERDSQCGALGAADTRVELGLERGARRRGLWPGTHTRRRGNVALSAAVCTM